MMLKLTNSVILSFCLYNKGAIMLNNQSYIKKHSEVEEVNGNIEGMSKKQRRFLSVK